MQVTWHEYPEHTPPSRGLALYWIFKPAHGEAPEWIAPYIYIPLMWSTAGVTHWAEYEKPDPPDTEPNL